MIVCRRCMTRSDDDRQTCVCGADLTGPDGISIVSGDRHEDTEEIPLLGSAGPATPPPPPPAGDPRSTALPRDPQSDISTVRTDREAAGADTPHVEDPELDVPTLRTEGGPGARTAEEPPSWRDGITPDSSGSTERMPRRVPAVGRRDVEVVSRFGRPNGPLPTPSPDTDEGPPANAPPEAAAPTPAGREGVRPDEEPDERGDDEPNVGAVEVEEPARPDPAPAVADAVKRQPEIGEVGCPECREPNPMSRRLCLECGATLPNYEADSTIAMVSGPPPDTLWRKLTRTTAHGEVDRRTWRQRRRDAGQAGTGYSADRTLETRLLAAAAVVAVIAGAVALLLFRDELFGDDVAAVAPSEVVPSVAGASPELPAGAAVDGSESTAFGVPFESVATDAEGVTTVGDGAVFELVLAGPTEIGAVEFDVAFPHEEAELDPALYPRARDLTLVFAGSVEIPVTLDSEPGPQRVDMGDRLSDPVDRFVVRLETVQTHEWETYDTAIFVEIGVVPRR